MVDFVLEVAKFRAPGIVFLQHGRKYAGDDIVSMNEKTLNEGNSNWCFCSEDEPNARRVLRWK